jgi:hypothetical protein
MMQDNSTVLIHGNSRVVNALILKAAESKQFNVIVTEGKPTCDGSGPRYIFQTQFLVWYCVYICVCTYMYYFWAGKIVTVSKSASLFKTGDMSFTSFVCIRYINLCVIRLHYRFFTYVCIFVFLNCA